MNSKVDEKLDLLVVAGSGGGGGETRVPVEDPDNLQSTSSISIIDLIGEGQIGGIVSNESKENSILLNGTPLRNKAGEVNFKNFTWLERVGLQDQKYIEGFGEGIETPFNKGVQLKSGVPSSFTISSANVDRVRILLAVNALTSTNIHNGDVSGSSVSFAFRLSTNGGAYKDIATKTITGKTTSRYQRSFVFDLPKTLEDGTPVTTWQGQVIRTTPDPTSGSIQNDSFFESYSEISLTKFSYPNSALVATRFDSETFSSIPKREYLVDGLLIKVPSNYNHKTRTYSGTWNGTYKLAPSSNPAWILYDLLLNERYGLGRHITVDMVDEARLYQIGQYCDQLVDDGFGGKEPRYTINCVINSRVAAYDLIVDICSAFNGMAYWSGDAVGFTIDAPSDPVMLVNNTNIVGDFSYSGTSVKDRHSIAVVTWNDPNDDYKQTPEPVEDADLIARYGIRKTEIMAFGCTSRGQAARVGKWMLYSESQQSEMIAFTLGLDSAYLLPGDLIQIQDRDRSGKRLGGRLLACTTTTATLDSEVDFADLKNLEINLRLEDGTVVDRPIDTHYVKTHNGKNVTVVSWASPIASLPVNLGVWIISSSSLEPVMARVVNIAQGDAKGTFNITAIPHNPSKYLAIENDLMLEVPKTTLLNSRNQVAPEHIYVKSENISSQGVSKTRMVISWDEAKGASQYEVEWKRNDGNWVKLPRTSNLSVEIEDVYAGIYVARIVAYSLFGAKSYPKYSATVDLQGKTGKPLNAIGFAVTSLLFGMKLDWYYPTNSSDTSYAVIEVSDFSNGSSPRLVGNVTYPTNTLTIQGLQGNLDQYYRIKTVDKSGNESDWSEFVKGTTSADPSQVLEILEGHIGSVVFDQATKDSLAQIQNNTNNLIKEVTDRINADVLEANNRATAIATAVTKEANDRTTAIAVETTNRANAIAVETTNRANAIAAESTARANAIADVARAVTKETTDRANAIQAEVTNRTNAIQAEAVARASAIAKEVTDRNAAISAEATARTNAIANKATEINNDVTTRIATVTTSINKEVTDRQTAITAETNARVAAVSSLQDGLMVETTQRKSEDASLLSNIETFKTSTNNSLASVQQKTDTNATNISAQATQINALDSRLTATDAKAGTALTNAATAQTTANTAVTQSAANATNITSLNASLGALDSDSLLPDYSLSTPSSWTSHYSYLMSQYFKTTTTGNVTNTVFRKDTSNPSPCWNYSVKSLPNTRAYKISFWVRRSADSNGGIYITNLRGTPNGLFSTANYGFLAISASEVPANEAWAYIEKVIDLTAQAAQYPRLKFGFAVGHTGANGWWELQGYKVVSVIRAGDTDSTVATAAALTTLDTKVTNVDGKVATNSTAITALNNDMTAVKADVQTKASSSALTALQSTVTNQGNTITSQGTSITNLTNRMSTAEGGLATKADSTTVSALDNKVTQQGNTITSQGTSITNLSNRVTTVEGTVATKADSSALSTLDSKVTAIDGKVTSNATALTSLQANFSALPNGGVNLLGTTVTNPVTKPTFTAGFAYDIEASSETPQVNRFKLTTAAATNAGIYLNEGGGSSAANMRLYQKGKYILSMYAKVASGTQPIDLKFFGTTASLRCNLDTNLRRYSVVVDVTAADGVSGCPLIMANPTGLAAGALVYIERMMLEYQVSDNVNPSVWVDGTNVTLDIIQSNAKAQDLFNTASSATSAVASRATALESRMNTAEGKIGTKAEATALNNYYTKTETEAVAAGKVAQFNAALKVGSANLLAQTKWKAPAFANVNTANGYEFSLVKSVSPFTAWAQFGVWSLAEIPEGSPVVFSFKIKALDNTPLSVGGHTAGIALNATKVLLDGSLVVGTTFSGGTPITIPNDGNFHKIVVFLTKSATANDSIYIQPNRATSYNQSVNCAIREVMLSIGNVDVDWVPPAEYVQGQLNANSAAINATNTEVSRVNGVVVAQGTSITNLQNNISAINGTLSTKADSSALTTLDNKVTAIDGKVTTNATSITQLSGKITDVDTTSKTALNNAATAQTTANTGVTKADAAASSVSTLRTDYEAKALQLEGADSTNAAAIAKTNTDLQSAQSALSNADTALGNRIDGLTTTVSDNLNTVRGEIQDVADSVTTLEGNTNTRFTNLQSSLNNLNTTVGTKADSSALNTLTTRVANVEGVSTTQATSINTLNSNLTKLDELARVMNSGKLVYTDPTFKVGANGVVVYNNTGNGNVTITRQARSTDNPTTSTHELLVKTVGTASPVWGGIFQSIQARANAVFLVKYIAKLPTGYSFVSAANALGTGASDKLYGQTTGTGKYETLYRITRCGPDGSFSNGGHLYVTGSPNPTADAPLQWVLASIELYDCTDFQDAPTTVLNSIADAKNTANTAVSQGQANASAINSLTTTVNANNAAVNGRIDTVASSVTTLEGNTNSQLNRLESAFTAVDAKAAKGIANAASAQQTADSAVTANTATASRVSTLESEMDAVESGLATKASASALQATNTEVSRVNGVVTSQGTSITNLTNNLNTTTTNANKALSAVEVKDTRSTNELPQWYWTNHPKRIVNEFKTASVIGVTGLGAYVNLETRVYYSDSSGGPILQTAIGVANPLLQMVRRSSGSGSNAVWSAWEQPLKTMQDTIDTKASTSALNSLDSKVTSIDGRVTANATSISTLQAGLTETNDLLGTVKTATAMAQETANSAVTANNAVANRVTDLEVGLDTVEADLTTKATTTALGALDTKVTNIDGKVTSQGSSITKLQSDLSTTDAKAGTALNNAATAQTTANTGVTKAEAAASSVNTLKSQYESKVALLDSADAANATAITKTNTDLSNAQTALSNADNALGSRIDNLTTTVNNNNTAVTGQIQSIANSVSTLEGNTNTRINSLVSELSTVDGKADLGISNAATAQTTANTAVSKADANANNITTLNSTLNGMVVGGQNLWSGVNKPLVNELGTGVKTILNVNEEHWRVTINAFDASGTATQRIDSMLEDTTMSALVANEDYVFTCEIRASKAFAIPSLYTYVGGSIAPKANIAVTTAWTRIVIPLKSAGAGLSGTTQLLGIRVTSAVVSAGDWYELRRVQLQKGNKATEFNRADASIAKDISAGAAATSALTTRVSNAEGAITSQGTSITNLQNSVSTINGALSNKADQSALNTLQSTVTSQGNTISTQGTAITNLQGSVTSINNALTTKADQSAMTALTSRVTATEGNISSQGSQISTLNNSLTVTTNTANAALPKVSSSNGANKVFRGILAYENNASNVDGNIVIQTPITFTSKMFKVNGSGYNYLAGKSDINFSVGGYAYSGTTIIQHGASNLGTMPLRIRLGVRNGTICIILSSLVSGNKWQYPKINLDAEIGYTLPPDSWQTGWSASVVLEADLSSYGVSGMVEPSLLNVAESISANASAISSLTNTVTQQGNTITSQSGSITSLQNSVNGINSTLSGKADSSAVSALTNRVTTAEGNINSLSSQTTSLSASLTKTINEITINDTRNDNQPPSWYWSNYPKRRVTELKLASTLGLAGMGAYVSLETLVQWSNSSGGAIKQTARSGDELSAQHRYSVNDTTWSAWKPYLKDINDVTNANATSIGTLNSQVTSINGTITSQSTSITKLQAEIGSTNAGGSLTNDYYLANPDDWLSHYGYAMSQYFKTVTDGKIGNTVFRKDTSNPSTCWNYNNSPLPNKKYLLSAWVRSTSDSDGAAYFTFLYTNDANPAFSTARYSTVGSFTVPKTNVWTYIEKVVDLTAQAYNSLRFGFAIGHGGTAGTWELQGFKVESYEAIDKSNANATALSTLDAKVTTIDGKVTTQATSLTSLNTTVNGHTTSINSQTTSINGIRGVKTLTIDTNGVISGYGLVSELINGQVTSSFGINATNFFIGPPSSNKKLFVVTTSSQAINGTVYPAGTWIDSAYIANATIKLAHIDKASIENLSAVSAKIGTFRTAESGRRVEISDNGIRIYGTQTFPLIEIGDF